MSSSDRISMYLDTFVSLTRDSRVNSTKFISEINKLRIWLQKHQSECVPDNSKQKLFTIFEICYRFQLQDSNLSESIHALFSDSLALPEGKLLTSKSKKKLLSWLHEPTISRDAIENENNSQGKWILVDISENYMMSIVSEGDDSQLDNITSEKFELNERIRKCFESEGYVSVCLNSSLKVIEAFRQDGKSL